MEYLVARSGPRGLEVLLRRWKDLGNFERAFRATFGATTAQFEEDWRRYVGDDQRRIEGADLSQRDLGAVRLVYFVTRILEPLSKNGSEVGVVVDQEDARHVGSFLEARCQLLLRPVRVGSSVTFL